jgi:hypothetical protein
MPRDKSPTEWRGGRKTASLLLTVLMMAGFATGTGAGAIIIDPNPTVQGAAFVAMTVIDTGHLITPDPNYPNYQVCQKESKRLDMSNRGSLHAVWGGCKIITTLFGGKVPKI